MKSVFSKTERDTVVAENKKCQREVVKRSTVATVRSSCDLVGKSVLYQIISRKVCSEKLKMITNGKFQILIKNNR